MFMAKDRIDAASSQLSGWTESEQLDFFVKPSIEFNPAANWCVTIRGLPMI